MKRQRSENSQVLGIRRGPETELLEQLQDRFSKDVGVELTIPQTLKIALAPWQEKRKRR